MAAIGGKRQLMDFFVHSDPSKRVLLAGTYNAHPLPTTAAIATMERLLMNDGEVYRHVEVLGAEIQRGIEQIVVNLGLSAVVARQGSAFCIYFMDHEPKDWHDLAEHHDFTLDTKMRKNLIEQGIYFFAMPVKQCSISAAHTKEDIALTLEQIKHALARATN